MSARRPLIVGLGGTIRAGSSTEKALLCSVRRAEAMGAETRLLGGEFPRPGDLTAGQRDLVAAIRAADGVIVASPGYHGSISGVIKNALDTLEFTSKDAAPYFSGKPVGTVITAEGGQAGGTTLMALRAIIHALRGWPTPFGAALSGGSGLFDETGSAKDKKDAWQLDTVAEQVVEFAQLRISR